MNKAAIILLLILFTSTLTAQTYEEMVTRSVDYVEKGDYEAAEQALKAALRKEPTNANNTMLMVNLGTIQRNLGKLDEALINYNVAIEKYPKAPFIRHNRAALLCEMNRFDEALLDYNIILENDEADLEALYRRGLIHLNSKNILAAEEDFEKIVKISPENLNGQMGMASIMMRRKEWTEAEKIYTDLIAKHKTNADLHFNRAECYLQLNKLANTQDDIKKAIELGYTDYPIYILRGRLRLAQYDRLLARQDFMKAQEMGADAKVVEEFLKLCK